MGLDRNQQARKLTKKQYLGPLSRRRCGPFLRFRLSPIARKTNFPQMTSAEIVEKAFESRILLFRDDDCLSVFPNHSAPCLPDETQIPVPLVDHDSATKTGLLQKHTEFLALRLLRPIVLQATSKLGYQTKGDQNSACKGPPAKTCVVGGHGKSQKSGVVVAHGFELNSADYKPRQETPSRTS